MSKITTSGEKNGGGEGGEGEMSWDSRGRVVKGRGLDFLLAKTLLLEDGTRGLSLLKISVEMNRCRTPT